MNTNFVSRVSLWKEERSWKQGRIAFVGALTILKELGHVILGNFSAVRMVIELTKIYIKKAQNYRRTLTKHRKAKKEHGWTKLEMIIWIAFG